MTRNELDIVSDLLHELDELQKQQREYLNTFLTTNQEISDRISQVEWQMLAYTAS